MIINNDIYIEVRFNNQELNLLKNANDNRKNIINKDFKKLDEIISKRIMLLNYNQVYNMQCLLTNLRDNLQRNLNNINYSNADSYDKIKDIDTIKSNLIYKIEALEIFRSEFYRLFDSKVWINVKVIQ